MVDLDGGWRPWHSGGMRRYAPPCAALIVVSLCLGLAACDAEPQQASSAAMSAAAAQSAPTPGTNTGQTIAPKRMAVSHGFVLRLPAADVEAAQRRHAEAAATAGGTVLTSTYNRSDDGRVNGSLSLRIPQAGFEAFAKLVAGPPASVVSHSVAAEDKTLAVLDVEKRLEIKRALRDRLQAMLKDPARASMADLVTLETEIAQVQADIESAMAQQAYLQTVTETIKVDITYQGVVAVAAAGIDLSPITYAMRNVGATFAKSIGSLISFLAALLPWLPVAAATLWATARLWRRWRRPAGR